MFSLHGMQWHTIGIQMDYHSYLLVKILIGILVKMKVRAVSLTFQIWNNTHFVPCV
jgi:hypothetical protein